MDIVGLLLSDAHLEDVADSPTAHHMWKSILDIFERHTILNLLSARRRFYTATITDGETILTCVNVNKKVP